MVTGSARRVGRAIAEALVADGWRVLVHARDGAAARGAAWDIGAVGGVGANLASPEQVERLATATCETFPDGLDLLVNCAATFERVDGWVGAGTDGWGRAMDVNARAPYLLTSALVPCLSAAKGCVVNVSDHAGQEHWPAFPVHSASKAALDSLTISGARSLARAGVRVNAVSPGTILAPEDWDEERIERERVAGGLGTPDELVRTVLELAGDATRTGEIVVL